MKASLAGDEFPFKDTTYWQVEGLPELQQGSILLFIKQSEEADFASIRRGTAPVGGSNQRKSFPGAPAL